MPPIYRLKTKTILLNALTGYVVGLGVISLFISGLDNPKPEWDKYWMIQPLVITPIFSAFGSLALLLPDFLKIISPWKRLLALLAGLFIYMLLLWTGIVLGLVGTMWD
ncbi:MAG: hypothetical protein ACK5CL_06660 [Sphingomonadales bacterium]|jgi:membrane protein CcdC involved in cytochrome C biogenesis